MTIWAAMLGMAMAEGAATWIRDGRALYRGETPWRQPPTLHGVPLTAGAGTCLACHGPRGEARSEAGVLVPSLQWQRLMQANPRRPAYTNAAQVLRAINEGLASDGRALDAPMPRFALDTDEQHVLLAYLQVLGTEADPVPGVDGQHIVLGTVLPLSGTQAAIGHAIRQAMQHRIERINAEGGVFGRHLELFVADSGKNAAAAAAALVRQGRVFALVASLVPAPDSDLLRTLATHETPMVATLGLPVAPPRDVRLTWLLPGIAQQVRELVAEMQRGCPPHRTDVVSTRVLYPSGSDLAALATEIPELRWQAVAPTDDLAALLQKDVAARTVLLLPPRHADIARLALVRQRNPDACVGVLAALSGQSDRPMPLRELLLLPMPPVPMANDSDARAILWPLLADSAIAVIAEALARTGRQLDTARFMTALHTLHGFAPRPGLALTFSAQQRHGFDMSYVWKEGPDETHSSRR